MNYEKAQTGWFMVAFLSIIIISLTICYLFKIGNHPLSFSAYIILTGVFALILLLFYRLKIKVDTSGIHIIYGIGIVRIKINPDKIKDVRIVKTPWYSGLGIRVTEKGMLYNIQGSNAVEVSYVKGKTQTVQIGSNDTLDLKQFIEKAYNIAQPNDKM